jgi:hypothetical protein
LLLTAVFAFQSLVAGETCPAPADVEGRVRAILHLPPERELAEGYVAERHEAGLYVELRAPDSTLIGQRTLPGQGSCDDLAQAAAVVLAAWLSDVHPDFAGALPEAPPPAPEPEKPAEPVPQPSPPPPPARPPRQAPSREPAPRPEPATHRLRVSLGAGLELSGKLALQGRAQLAYVPRGRGFGIEAFAAISTTRSDSLGPGTIRWRRWPVGVGPVWRGGEGWTWEVAAGPTLAWLRFAGSGFDHPSASSGAQWGASASVRLASSGPRYGLFASLDSQVYPGDFKASASSPEQQWAFPVPRLALGLTIGAWVSP